MGEVGQNIQTSSSKISHGYIMNSMVIIVNNTLLYI